jgi:hypothetical protein
MWCGIREFFFGGGGGGGSESTVTEAATGLFISPGWWVWGNRWNAWHRKRRYSDKTCCLPLFQPQIPRVNSKFKSARNWKDSIVTFAILHWSEKWVGGKPKIYHERKKLKSAMVNPRPWPWIPNRIHEGEKLRSNWSKSAVSLEPRILIQCS